MSPGSAPQVVSVNVGTPRTVDFRGTEVLTSIWKFPVDGPVPVSGTNLDGDRQADLTVHGGTDKAVYAYAVEDSAWWTAELSRDLGPAPFGENLSTRGIDLSAVVIGERWRIGTAEFEASQPRVPCFKLGIRHADQGLPRKFAAAGRPGVYLRIVGAGEVRAGDRIELLSRPSHGVTVGLVDEAYHRDRSLAPQLLLAPELTPSWHDWARERL